MQVTQITSLEKETINEAPSIKDLKVLNVCRRS